MSYFRYFNKVPYDVEGNGVTRNITNITNFVNISKAGLDDIAFYSFYTIPDGYRPDNVSYELYGTTEYYWTFFLINDTLVNYYDDWPKAQSQIKEYSELKYDGLAALTNDDLFGKFTIGETITGQLSGATGTIVEKHPTTKWIKIEKTSTTNFRLEGESLFGINSNDSISATSIDSAAYAPAYYVDSITGERTRKRSAGVRAITYFEVENEDNLTKSKIRVIKPEFISKVAAEFIDEIRK